MDDKHFSFSELVDLTTFARLLDSFYRATGIPNGLVAPNGDLLTQSGWTDACAKFHRAYPGSNQQCQQSNIQLMQELHDSKVSCARCKNGLLDYATPVVIEGKQLATLFLGQTLDALPDLPSFSQRAQQFEYDEEAYLKAIRAVPVISQQQMESHMKYMVEVAQILADSGLARLRHNRLQEDLSHSTQQRIQIEDLLKLSPVGISWADTDGRIEYVNQQFSEMFGYTLEDLPDLDTWILKAFPDETYRQQVLTPWLATIGSQRKDTAEWPELEANITCKDGSIRRILIRFTRVRDKQLANFTDITAHWLSEMRNRAHNDMLEMVAKAEPLSDILHAIVQVIEQEDPSSLCSILLLDDEERHLHNAAAPSLPTFYSQAIDGVAIGPGVGSCGTAACLGQRVIVEDISTHEYWQDFKQIASQAGLGACWSEPIIAADGKVLGTFAIYHSEPSVPGKEDIDRIGFAANMAAIAIENRKARDELVKRELAFRSLAENAPVQIARCDQQGSITYLNPLLAKNLPLPSKQLIGEKLTHFPQLMPFAQRFQQAIAQVLETGIEYSFETEIPSAHGGAATHIISMVAERDESDRITGVLAMGLDITERKRLEQELERQAHLDFLTELINRRHFIHQAKVELSRIDRYGGELSLVMFDVDQFKNINDSHGHNAGDRVLQHIAEITRQTMRTVDLVGRLGGEEFVVLLPNTGAEKAFETAERLRQAIADGLERADDGTEIRFTASFGVVTAGNIADARRKSFTIDDLLNRADKAMYQAKSGGRNRVCQAVSTAD